MQSNNTEQRCSVGRVRFVSVGAVTLLLKEKLSRPRSATLQNNQTQSWILYKEFASLYFAFSFTIGILIVKLLEYYLPVTYVHLIAEDAFGEYATAISFGFSGVIFAWSASREKWLRRAFLALAAILVLGIAGEEVSWGQRILAINTPELIRGINAQNELTLHNMGSLQQFPFHEVVGTLLILVMGLSIVAEHLKSPHSAILLIPLPSVALWPALMATSFTLIFKPMVKGDEIAELLLSLAVLGWAMDVLIQSFIGSRSQKAAFLAINVTVYFAIGFLALFLTIFAGKSMAWRYNVTASRDYPEADMFHQAEILYRHILAHPELIQPNTLENYARLRSFRNPSNHTDIIP